MDKDPFDYLQFGQSSNENIRATVASSYQLIMAVGVIGLVVTFIVIGVTLAVSGPEKRAEALQELKWKVIIAIVFFSMITLLSFVLKIVGSIA